MHQLTQQLKSGHMEILEVPFPALNKGQVLVRNHYSVISSGTEAKTVTDARKGYIAKARSRQKEVKQVLEMIRTQGIKETWQTVMNKLETPSPLGYSCAGEVIATGEGVNDLKPGDYVACGGQGAYHSDVVVVYRNLCSKVPPEVDLRHAAFTTIACIALHGIRQAELQVGGNCVVIGLGLIGQLTMQLLEASGIRAIGIDIDPRQVEAVNNIQDTGSRIQGTDSGPQTADRRLSSVVSRQPSAYLRSQDGLDKIIAEETSGYGTDAVIITAGTSSLDPVEFAGTICRKKGKVVIVGAVPTGFSRENYFKKELDLRMSSSYGPGRYDPAYEEKGVDYPIGYVRWTENRNMAAFLNLLAAGRLNIGKLITHTFTLDKAPEAYEMILGKQEPFTGILIRYDVSFPLEKSTGHRVNMSTGQQVNRSTVSGPPSACLPSVGFIGAGNFAQNMLLPRLKGLCTFTGVATAQGNESIHVAKKYGFAYATDSADKIIEDPDINTIFITTRHNLHAEFVIKAINAGKNVFVEKPLAMTLEELEKIRETYNSSPLTAHRSLLMVGFNRRFSPYTTHIKSLLPAALPKAIMIRVNAGIVPKEHWVHDPETGGGRIIGEACHFIDLAAFLAGAKIRSVSADFIRDPSGRNDTCSVTLGFDNDSIGSVSYFSNGNKSAPKELIEVFCGGTIARINDFRSLEIFGNRKRKIKHSGQDKGHAAELRAFISSIRNGSPCPVPFEESYHSTYATFQVLMSLQENRKIILEV